MIQEMDHFDRVGDLVNLSQDEKSRRLDGAVEDIFSCVLPKKYMQVNIEKAFQLHHTY